MIKNMMIQVTELPELTEIPEWIIGMTLCHISYDNRVSLCGTIREGMFDCGYYDNEPICPTCGNPTCPRCAQLCDIMDNLGLELE